MLLRSKSEYYTIMVETYTYFEKLENMNKDSLQYIYDRVHLFIDDLTGYFNKKIDEERSSGYYFNANYYASNMDYIRRGAKRHDTIIKRIKEYCELVIFYLTKNYYIHLYSYLTAIRSMINKLIGGYNK